MKIENPSSNLLEICSYIYSFLHCRLVQTKTSFLLELTWQKSFSITYKSNMKTTRQSFQMIAHCLFTSIDSNEKSREIRMRVKISECGDSILPRGSGPASGRFPEFRHLCGRFLHKTGGLAGLISMNFIFDFCMFLNHLYV